MMPSRKVWNGGLFFVAARFSLKGPRTTITWFPRERSFSSVRVNAFHCSELVVASQSKVVGEPPDWFQGLWRGLLGPRWGSSAGALGTRRVIWRSGFL